MQVDVGSLGLGEWEAVDRLRGRRLVPDDEARGAARGHRALDVDDDDVTQALELVRRRWGVAGPPDTLAPELDRLIADRQAERLPWWQRPVAFHKGELVKYRAVRRRLRRAARRDSRAQYRVGSITKTFTATAVMQLRDEGKLDLDDRLEQHLDGVANGTPTLRRLLCILYGLVEAGEMLVTGESPTGEQLMNSMKWVASSSRRGRPPLLGRVRPLGQWRASGASATRLVDEQDIRPLGLTRHDLDTRGAEKRATSSTNTPHRLARRNDLAAAQASSDQGGVRPGG